MMKVSRIGVDYIEERTNLSNFKAFLPPELMQPEIRNSAVEEIRRAISDFQLSVIGVKSIGQTTITVQYDVSLGNQGLELGQKFLEKVIYPYLELSWLFQVAGGNVSVAIVPLSGKNDGSGGAYHYGCNFDSGGTLYLDATFERSDAVEFETALYIAELSECFMGVQGRGWNCGYSNGEGLSRFCTERLTPSGTFTWYTAPAWVKSGYPDWVNRTDTTDTNFVSTGCATLFLYWLRWLGYSSRDIIAAGGETLAATYRGLTGKGSAYQDFVDEVQRLPEITSDNPWPPRGQTSKMAPTVAVFNQNLWLGSTSDSVGEALMVCPSVDGRKWRGQSPVSGQFSKAAPILTAFNDKLWMAFIVKSRSNDLAICSSADGRNWTDNMAVGQFSHSAPSLAVFNNRLWLAFVANSRSNDLLICSSADGRNWTDNSSAC